MKSGFICGCGHSGTTLMATILATHRDVYVPPRETNIFFKWTPLAKYRYWKLKRAAAAAGKSYVVEKTPRHIRRVDRIRRLVPGARFIVPVRDGRDVVASLTQRLGDKNEALERWISDNDLVLAQRQQPDVLVYRYEDLVEDPRRIVEQICGFLGLSFDTALLDYHKQPQRWFNDDPAVANSPHVQLRNEQINKPIFDGRGRWHSTLGQEELEEITSGRGRHLMQAFGYLE